jgi:hypothetical protein
MNAPELAMDAVAKTGSLQCRESGGFGKSRYPSRAPVCGDGMAARWRGFGGATGVAEQLTATREFCDKNDTASMLRSSTAI